MFDGNGETAVSAERVELRGRQPLEGLPREPVALAPVVQGVPAQATDHPYQIQISIFILKTAQADLKPTSARE
jgi:hypothetical protein